MAKKSIKELLQQNDNTVYPNTNREITEEKLHNHLQDIIESSVNTLEGNILILKEFIIRSNKEPNFIITEINKLFFDYGKASINTDMPSGHNWEHYKYVVFKIVENGNVIYNDILPEPANPQDNPLDIWLQNNLSFSGGGTSYPVKITAYLKVNLPAINRLFGYNHSFFQLKGADIVKYRNTKLKTFAQIPSNFPNLFNSLLDRYVDETGKTRPGNFDNSAIWISGVQSSFYTAHKMNNVIFYPFGYNSNTENYGRRVWNSNSGNWENIGSDPSANGFDPSHFIVASFIYEFNDDNNFSYRGRDITIKEWKEPVSFVRFYLWKVIKNGNEDCYYFSVKPLGLDIFELNYFDTSAYKLYALLDDGYSNPVIRRINAEDITLENANKSFRITKSHLFLTNIMLNKKTKNLSIDERAFKTCRFFYCDNEGNISGLSPQIKVVINKRGYKIGLMINNI